MKLTQTHRCALHLLLITLLSLSSNLAHTQVYKHVDEKGNVTFTDQPPPNATPVEISAPNTAAPPSGNSYPKRPPSATPQATGSNYKVTISSPANETIIPRGPGNFTVSVSLSPKLRGGHKLQLLLDGEAREAAQTGSSWALTNVFRGERRLEVAVVDGKGKQLAKSKPIVVFVFRPSSNNNNPRPRPPRPTPH